MNEMTVNQTIVTAKLWSDKINQQLNDIPFLKNEQQSQSNN